MISARVLHAVEKWLLMVERWTKRNDTKFANTLPLILIFKCGTTTRRIFYRNYTYKNIRSSNVYFKHARYRTFYTLVTHPPSFYNWIILTDRWIVITKSLYIFAYIKSDTVVLKWSCKKKKIFRAKGRLIRREVREASSSPPLVHHPKIRCERCFAIFVSFSREAKQ